MRLIDADAFKRRNERLLECDFPYITEETLEELLDDAPTIEERKKGKWEVCGTFDDFLRCSCCGYKKPWNEDIFNYCPNCGAEMDKDDE